MTASGVQPAEILVRRWGEAPAERPLPGCLRIITRGEHAGGVEHIGDVWVAYWRTARMSDRLTEHATAEQAVRAVIASGWARHLGARRASKMTWTRAARRLARGSAR